MIFARLRHMVVPLALALAMLIGPAMAQTGPQRAEQSIWPAPIADAIAYVAQWQRQANGAFAAEVRRIKRGEGIGAVLALALIGYIYGVLHTLGPGHGKAIVAAYFLDRRRRIAAGLFAGGWIALTHTVSAIGIVLVLSLIIGLASDDTLAQARWIEAIAYGLIVALGLWRLWVAITGRDPHHHHDHHSQDHGHAHDHAQAHGLAHDRLTKPDAMLGLLTLAGFVPCTGAMIVMLFAMANGLIWVGVWATVAISVGMATTLAAIGLVTVLLRRRFVDRHDKPWLARALSAIAAMVVVVFGGLLFLGALARVT